MFSTNLRIIFFGTTDFAVTSLNFILENNINIVGVVTVPDKPAGRGQKLQISPVKKYAIEHNLFLLQPIDLKTPDFIDTLRELKANLQIVIAFRILPEIVWGMPPFGTFNLHASLLPQYRGAAPINRAIMNGEKETGITTFFLNNSIDTGKIILQEKIQISENETAGELHDKLKLAGAHLVLKTIRLVEDKINDSIEQSVLTNKSKVLKTASKLLKEDCRINWNRNVDEVYNFIRGLSPTPCAFTEFISPDNSIYYFKIYHSVREYKTPNCLPGKIFTDGTSYLAVSTKDGLIQIKEIQLRGKKRLFIKEFLRGFKISIDWKVYK